MNSTVRIRSRALRCRVLLSALAAASALFAPDIEFGAAPPDTLRMVVVIVRYAGVEPQELERLITEPLELRLSAVAGIDSLRSSSEAGRVRVRAYIRPDSATAQVYAEIRDVVAALYEQFPEAVQRPQLIRGDSEAAPVAVLSVEQPGRPLRLARRLAEEKLQREIEKIPGVARTRVTGGTVEEIHVDVDSTILAVSRIDWSNLSRRLSDRHVIRSGGSLRDELFDIPVLIDGRVRGYSELQEIGLRTGDGTMPLGRLARVGRSEREPETISRIDGEHAVLMSVTAASEANLLAVSARIRRLVSEWRSQPDLEVTVLSDAGGEAREAIERMLNALLISLLAVVAVVGLASRSLYRAFEIALVLPLSVLVAAALSALSNTPVDPAMLAGFALSCGLVIDGAVVLTGSNAGDSTHSVVTSVLTTVAALVPFVLYPDLAPGAESIAVAAGLMIAVSVPLALLIRGCRIFPRTPPPTPRSAPAGRLCSLSLRHSRLVITVAFVVTALVTAVTLSVGSDPVGSRYGRTVRLHAEFESGASARSVDRRTRAIASRLREGNNIKNIEYTARRDNATIAIQPAPESTVGEVVRSVERLQAAIADVSLHVLSPTGASDRTTAVEIAVTGPERARTRELARALATSFTGTDDTASAILHFKDDPQAVVITPDRRRLAGAGLSPRELGETVRWALHGPVVLKWQQETGETDVRLRAERNHVSSASDLRLLPVPRTGMQPVPAGAVSDFGRSSRAGRVDRYNRRRAAFVTLLYRSTGLERSVRLVRSELSQFQMPPGYAAQIDRRYDRAVEELRQLWYIFAAAAAAIFLLTSTASESWRVAAFTLLSLPCTVAFTLLPFVSTGQPLNGGVIVATVMLVGISANNAILLGFQARSTGIRQAIRRRSADLLIAAVTTSVAASPLLFLSVNAREAAGELGFSVGIVLLVGSVVNVVLTFILVPALWKHIDNREAVV